MRWICTQVFYVLWLCRSGSRSRLLFQPYLLLRIQVKLFTKILKCLSLLTQSQFRVKFIISDKHTTNVKVYNIITNFKTRIIRLLPYLSHQNIYLLFDTCHLIKNIRNNLLSKDFFDIPAFEFTSVNFNISFPADLFSGHIFTLFMKETYTYLHTSVLHIISTQYFIQELTSSLLL